jgi:hypothetical protein
MATLERLKLKQAQCIILPNDRWHLKVDVSFHNQVFTGELISYSEDNNFEAMAIATLKAVSCLLPEHVSMNLADAGQTYSYKTEMGIFIVVIQVVEGTTTKYVSGSSLISLPIMHAPVKAVFNAINRTLVRHLPS